MVLDWQLILESLLYGGLAIALMFVGVLVIDLAIPAFKFSEELKEQNPAVGYMIAGIFIAVGIIVYAVIA